MVTEPSAFRMQTKSQPADMAHGEVVDRVPDEAGTKSALPAPQQLTAPDAAVAQHQCPARFPPHAICAVRESGVGNVPQYSFEGNASLGMVGGRTRRWMDAGGRTWV
jgi:hypothetical protein